MLKSVQAVRSSLAVFVVLSAISLIGCKGGEDAAPEKTPAPTPPPASAGKGPDLKGIPGAAPLDPDAKIAQPGSKLKGGN